jgi:glycosyl transferase family 25
MKKSGLENAFYCINLARNTKRKQYMQDLAIQTGIELKFFDAINGQELPPSTLESHLAMARQTSRNLKNIWKQDFTPGEIGCALSHINLWQRVSEDTNKGAVILEDDVVFAADFKQLLSEIDQITTPNHLILLGGSTANVYFNQGQAYSAQNTLYLRKTGLHRLTKGNKVGVPIDRVWGAYAYWIGREAASQMVDHAQHAFMVADQFTSDSPLLGIRLLALNKPIVFPDFSFTSDLRSEHAHLEVARHQKSTVLQKLINNYKSIRRLFISNFLKGEYAYLYEAPFSKA